jgi:hypothetical protein
MSRSKRLGVIAASILIPVGALLGLSATPALATPNFCYGDVCANVAGETYSQLFIHTWAFRTTFTGHFEVQTPEHTVRNSGDTKNVAGGYGPTFALPNNAQDDYGYYCITGWKKLGPGDYTDVGYFCFVA